MKFEITGTIRYVGEAQSLPTTSGKPFTKREVLVETNEQYPESVLLELSNEDAVNFSGFVGQQATFCFHIRSRKTSAGRFFSSIQAWRYEIHY